MAFTHTITRTYSVGGRSISSITSYTGDNNPSLDISIPDSSDGLLVPFSLERGNGIVGLIIQSDQAITIYTNADDPGETDKFILVANVPYIWHTGWYDSVLVTADITALYADNASGSAAQLQIEALIDVLA